MLACVAVAGVAWLGAGCGSEQPAKGVDRTTTTAPTTTSTTEATTSTTTPPQPGGPAGEGGHTDTYPPVTIGPVDPLNN